MMRKMGRRAGAIGFALYLDLLEQLRAPSTNFDVDVLVLYDSSVSPDKLYKTVNGLISDGKQVSVQRAIPEKLRYRECYDIRQEASKC